MVGVLPGGMVPLPRVGCTIGMIPLACVGLACMGCTIGVVTGGVAGGSRCALRSTRANYHGREGECDEGCKTDYFVRLFHTDDPSSGL